jgi:plasmid stabilization system protein ParE
VIRVEFAPEVPDELADAARWYESRRSGLGKEFLDEIATTLPLIASRPRSFPALQDVDERLDIRRALLPRFPYAVVFLLRDEELRVLAVAHAKRRPGYWLHRVRQ